MQGKQSLIAAALCGAGLAVAPECARADDLVVSVQEYPSWPEVLVAVRKEPLEAGDGVHATVSSGGNPLPCDRFVLRLGFRAMTAFRVGACVNGVTDVVVTHPDHLPTGVDVTSPDLALRAEPVIPGVTVARAEGGSSLGPVTSGSGESVVQTGSSVETSRDEVVRTGGLIVAVSFLIAPAFIYGFLEGGMSLDDSLIWTTVICGGGMLIGGIVAVIGAAMPARRYGSVRERRHGVGFAGAGVAPTQDGQGAVGAVVIRF